MGTGRNVARSACAALAGFVLGVAPVAPASAAECVKPGGGGGCWPTIQQGIDAASPGETVLIRPGTYRERFDANKAVVVAGDGTAPSAVVVDGGDGDAPLASVTAAGVTIRNLTLRNNNGPGVDVTAAGSGARLSKVFVQHAYVQSSAPGTAILDSRVEFGTVYGYAAGFRMERSVVRMGYVTVDGDDALVRGCEVRDGDSTAISLQGARPRALDNVVSNASDSGIRITGTEAEARGNVIDTVNYGIAVSSTRPRVTGNRVNTARNDGIFVDCTSCEGGEVSGNTVRDVLGDGIQFYCTVPRVLEARENSAAWTGGHGFSVYGSCVSDFDRNKAANAVGSCFWFNGAVDGSLVRRNEAVDCSDDGFRLEGDNCTLRNNTATRALLAGFHVALAGSGSTLEGNTAKQSDYRYCEENPGANTIGAGNNFSSSTCPP